MLGSHHLQFDLKVETSHFLQTNTTQLNLHVGSFTQQSRIDFLLTAAGVLIRPL